MGKKKNIDRINEFLDTYATKQTVRHSKDIDKSVKYRAKNSYPTVSKFEKEYTDEHGLHYSLSYGKKSDSWYEQEKSERGIEGNQYFFIKASKGVRESGGIPDIYEDRTLTDKNGNKIQITVSGVNISPNRATGELFAENVRPLGGFINK